MALIMLIIQIIGAIPTIIRIIKEILKLINGLPTEGEKIDARLKLREIIMGIKAKGGLHQCDTDKLNELLNHLTSRSTKAKK